MWKSGKSEVFDEVFGKQLEFSKKTFRTVFLIVGAVFFVLGIVLYFLKVTDVSHDVLIGLVFMPFGMFLMLVGLVISFLIRKK